MPRFGAARVVLRVDSSATLRSTGLSTKEASMSFKRSSRTRASISRSPTGSVSPLCGPPNFSAARHRAQKPTNCPTPSSARHPLPLPSKEEGVLQSLEGERDWWWFLIWHHSSSCPPPVQPPVSARRIVMSVIRGQQCSMRSGSRKTDVLSPTNLQEGKTPIERLLKYGDKYRNALVCGLSARGDLAILKKAIEHGGNVTATDEVSDRANLGPRPTAPLCRGPRRTTTRRSTSPLQIVGTISRGSSSARALSSMLRTW